MESNENSRENVSIIENSAPYSIDSIPIHLFVLCLGEVPVLWP